MLYADTSLLVKKYIRESGSAAVLELISQESIIATCTIGRAEVSASFAKAIRVGSLTRPAAEACRNQFVKEWQSYFRIRVTETLVASADRLAWTLNLRGYDAVHLAAALEWQNRLAEPIVLGTFDLQLWKAAGEMKIRRFPESIW